MYIKFKCFIIFIALFLLKMTNIKVVAFRNANEIKSCRALPTFR